MAEPESDKGKNTLDPYSGISRVRKKTERAESNVSFVSFHRNTSRIQDTQVLPLEIVTRKKANSLSPVYTLLWICKHTLRGQHLYDMLV